MYVIYIQENRFAFTSEIEENLEELTTQFLSTLSIRITKNQTERFSKKIKISSKIHELNMTFAQKIWRDESV